MDVLKRIIDRSPVPPSILQILLGVVLGPSVLGALEHGHSVSFLAETGVFLLLVQVGSHLDIEGMRRVGRHALSVGVGGVVAPFAVTFSVARWPMGQSTVASMFMATALSVTSIGITAHVFRANGLLQSDEARIVLGAAVVDDVIGLAVLTIVTVVSGTGSVDAGGIGRTLSIVGALSIGIALGGSTHGRVASARLSPVAALLVPFFFLDIGLRVDLSLFGDARVERWTVVLIAVAVATKAVSGLLVRDRSVDRLLVGISMVPRGEVGLVVAGTAIAAGAVDPSAYAMVLATVVASTILVPPFVRWRAG